MPLLRLYEAATIWGDSMVVRITGGQLPAEEVERYKAYAEEHHPGTHTLEISVDGEWVDLTFHVTPFERVRRITGYLVGTVDRWNDAKRAELADRLPHGKA